MSADHSSNNEPGVDEDRALHGAPGEETVMEEDPAPAEIVQNSVPIPGRNYIRAIPQGSDDAIECWHLQCLVYGDGSATRSGHKLEEGKWYGSAELNGDHESFREVDIDSLVLSSRGQTVVSWSRCVLRNGSRRRVPDERPLALLRFTPTGQIEAHLRRNVKYWLKKYRGAVCVVGGPSTRAPIAGIELEFSREFGSVLQRGRLGRCVLDSIVNAVDRVVGRNPAVHVARNLETVCSHFKDLCEVPKLVQALKAGVKALCVEVDKENMFKWLVDEGKGTYIVRVEQSGAVDYVVVIDTTARIIVDSAEEFPIRLTVETLRKSGGDNADKLRVKEVLQIVRQ